MSTMDRLAAALADRYRIVHELGAGGMATVYLADDLRHERQVAIKVLRPELAAVIGAERFLREIRTIAGLQHPHILGLIDSGELDGTAYYVMPFVDGESLRDRLLREKQLPIADAVRIATEVAAALDYAHRRGVIHRDVKPENILLHDGQALVADFGIALAVSTAGGGRMTETGLSLGTPHYMSPEQAMGEREITARSDVYALGALTYEMLTGDPPFTGSSAQSIVAKVMTEKPAPPSRLRDTVPEAVEDAVLTALQKLPADRFGSAAEFAAALHGGGAIAGRMGMPRTAARRAATTSRASRASRAAWPAAVIALAALAAAAWFRPAPEAVEALPLRVSVSVPTLGGASTALQRQIGITPDGSTLIYAAIAPDGENRTMRLVLHDTAAAVVSGVVPYLADYVLSPDGREFIGAVGYTQMYRYPLGGGSGRPLPPGIAVGALAWAPDGTLWISAAADVERGLVRVAPDGTVTRPFGASSRDYWMMQVLPGGRTALATRTMQGLNAGPVLVIDLESGTANEIISRPVVEVRFTAGYLVFVLQDGTLEAVPFDAKRGRVVGEPVQFATGVSVPANGGVAQIAVAENGTVAYIPEGARDLLLVDREGRSRPATPERRNFHAPMFSPDGSRVSVDFTTTDGRDVWTLDLADGRLSRATFDRDGHDATWTPGGEAITYISAKTGTLGIYRARPGQAEPPDSLLVSGSLSYTGHWLPDGSALVTVGNALRPESRTDIGIVRNAGRGPIEPLVASRFEDAYPAVSPDGRWLAFNSDQSGRNEVYVRPLDRPGDQVQVSVGGGVEPVWNRAGGELFYRAGPGAGTDLVAAAISFTPTAARVTGRTTLVSVAGMANATPHANYDVSPDGRQFVMVGYNQATRIVIIQNLPALIATLGGRPGGTR
jgi:eukaryotic-like serine/threonine-protein kinase